MKLSDLNFDLSNIEFTKKFKNDEVVDIDIKKLDKAWSLDNSYISYGGYGGIKNRYINFLKFLNNEILKYSSAIEMPEINLTNKNVPLFTNGRHRFAVLRDLGLKKMPVAVPKNQAKKFSKLFGV